MLTRERVNQFLDFVLVCVAADGQEGDVAIAIADEQLGALSRFEHMMLTLMQCSANGVDDFADRLEEARAVLDDPHPTAKEVANAELALQIICAEMEEDEPPVRRWSTRRRR